MLYPCGSNYVYPIYHDDHRVIHGDHYHDDDLQMNHDHGPRVNRVQIRDQIRDLHDDVRQIRDHHALNKNTH